MAYKLRSAKPTLATRVSFPPRADEVAGCPPHFWVIQQGWQKCKKCGDAREIERLYPLWKWRADG